MTDNLAIVRLAADCQKSMTLQTLVSHGSMFSWILDLPILSKNLKNMAAFGTNWKIVCDHAESMKSRLYGILRTLNDLTPVDKCGQVCHNVIVIKMDNITVNIKKERKVDYGTLLSFGNNSITSIKSSVSKERKVGYAPMRAKTHNNQKSFNITRCFTIKDLD